MHGRDRIALVIAITLTAIGLFAETQPKSLADQVDLPLSQATPTQASVVQAPSTSQSISPADQQPVVLSINSPASFTAKTAKLWRQSGADYALLEGDVRFELDGYGFQATRAVVRIDRVQLEDDPELEIRHLSIYLDHARALQHMAVAADAPRLLVTAATTGPIGITADLPTALNAPPAIQFVADAYARIAEHFTPTASQSAKVAQPATGTAGSPFTQQPAQVAGNQEAGNQTSAPASSGQSETASQLGSNTPPPNAPDEILTEQTQAQPNIGPDDSVLPLTGVVRWDADQWEIELKPDDPDEAVVSLIGNVQFMYQDAQTNRVVTLQAQNAVIFINASSVNQDQQQNDPNRQLTDAQTAESQDIKGVYLEGGVTVTDGAYTLRSPRVYYDLVRDRAILLEAVVYSFDATRRVPMYVRADVLRQVSRTQFQANEALVTTSSFAVPHFAIGARQLTIREKTSQARFLDRNEDGTIAEGPITYHEFEAQDITALASQFPVFFWPSAKGDTRSNLIKGIRGGYSSKYGPTIETTWDAASLLGIRLEEGSRVDARLDYLGDHGVAVGIDAAYDNPDRKGRLEGYLIPEEHTEDDLGSRELIDRTGDTRGYAKFEHQQQLGKGFVAQAQAAYVSDPTVLEVYEPGEAYTARPYETSLYLNRFEDDWSATAFAKTNLNDYPTQLTTLLAPGYTVEKAPELGFYKIGTPLFNGAVNYFGENRVSNMQINVPEGEPEDWGFYTNDSRRLFGIRNDLPFANQARFNGLPDGWVLRGDSRHELNAPMSIGGIDVTPYATGRVTAYDDDFNEYQGNSDNYRLWGSVGFRASTSFQTTSLRVRNSFFDINGIRHIVEPSINAYYTDSSVKSEELPVFDPDIESLNDSPGVRFGLRNSWQTQRGGHGRWRRVDWIVWDISVAWSEDEPSNTVILPRYFAYRPELMTGDDHAHTEVRWLATETLSFNGEATYIIEDGDRTSSNLAQWRVGAAFAPDPALYAYTDYQELDELDSELWGIGFMLKMTDKYRLGYDQVWDLSDNDRQEYTVTLFRQLPGWTMAIGTSVNDIDDETRLSVSLIPNGFGDPNSRLRLGGSQRR